MKYVLRIILFLSLLGATATAKTVSSTGKISSINYYGNGMVLVYGFTFSGEADHCAGSRAGFVIAANYPNMDRLMSLLLTAKASQSVVTVHTDIPEASCWAPKFTTSTYLNIK